MSNQSRVDQNKFGNKQIIIGIVILAAMLGVAGWFFTTKQSQNNADLTQKSIKAKSDKREEQNEKLPAQGEKTEDIDTSNWKTYRNEELGFEFKYPSECEMFDGEGVSSEKTAMLNCHARRRFDEGIIPDDAKFFGMVYIFYNDQLNERQYMEQQRNNCVKGFGMEEKEAVEKIKSVLNPCIPRGLPQGQHKAIIS